MKRAFLSAAALAVVLTLPGAASAQTNEITIGITISTTGPAAALGIPEVMGYTTIAGMPASDGSSAPRSMAGTARSSSGPSARPVRMTRIG